MAPSRPPSSIPRWRLPRARITSRRSRWATSTATGGQTWPWPTSTPALLTCCSMRRAEKRATNDAHGLWRRCSLSVVPTGTLTFAPGETTKTITIEVKGDNKKEADETFYLDLFGNSGNSLFDKFRGIGTIL